MGTVYSGQGVVENSPKQRPMRQQVIRTHHQRDRQQMRLSSSSEDLRRQLDKELDEIQQIKDKVCAELRDSTLNAAKG